MLELKIKEYKLPKEIDFNDEEIKSQIKEKVSFYKNLVYTEDQLQEAKKDRASLNKFFTALENRRKEVKKECLEPYETFEKKINEITAIIREPIALIDKQVKDFEEKEREEKRKEIEKLFNEIDFLDFVKLENVFDTRWLNKSVSLSKVESELKEKNKKIRDEVKSLNALPYAFESLEVYKETFDLNAAICEGHRLKDIQERKQAEIERKKKEEAERKLLEEQAKTEAQEKEVAAADEEKEHTQNTANTEIEEAKVREIRSWIGFKVHLTKSEAIELSRWLRERNIVFKALQ